MKKRITILLLSIVCIFCIGCGDFERGYDKFSLRTIGSQGVGWTYYAFEKNIDDDIIVELKSAKYPNGYELYGEGCSLGQWEYVLIGHNGNFINMYIDAKFLCKPNESMGDTKLNIYFNYTVASTGERKEEVWEVDFGQKPYEDKRGE